MSPTTELARIIEGEDMWEKQLDLARNEYLKVSGSVDRNLYYVQEGSLRLFMIREFEEHTIRFAYTGNFFAALDSFITGRPSELYIQAIKRSQVKVLSRARFMEVVQRSPEHSALWTQVLELTIVQQLEREQDILTSSPTERYERVMQRSPQLFQEIPHKYIASYLRMTPETLSRIKKS